MIRHGPVLSSTPSPVSCPALCPVPCRVLSCHVLCPVPCPVPYLVWETCVFVTRVVASVVAYKASNTPTRTTTKKFNMDDTTTALVIQASDSR